jgi:nucleoside-diphosphate-sugar epimerase
MIVSICGLGYLGLPLARLLTQHGHLVSGTTTTPEKLKNFPRTELLRSPALPSGSITDCDVLIINIPPGVDQLSWLKSWDLTKTKKILFVSSTSALHTSGRNSEVLRSEEDWIKSGNIPWIILRPGGLLGHGRHPGKILAGRSDIKGGKAPVNLIHADDVIGFILTIINENIKGECFDLVSDEHHTKEEFYSEFCRRMKLPLPEFDSTDNETGVIISNEKMKCYYQLKFPTLIGKSL